MARSTLIDLTGQKFGRLTVIERAENYIEKSGCKRVQWFCQCDCGNTTKVIGKNLKLGITKSCGCLQKDRASRAKKKYNTYDLSGEYGIGYTSKNEEFYFDLEDYDKIKDYCWYKSGKYIGTNCRDGDSSKILLLHRLIMNAEDGFVVDHKNHCEYDNRKENLRVCSYADNLHNVKLTSRNTSGVSGVCYYSRINRWCARISVNKKVVVLGYFKNFDDAVKARKDAEKMYYGEFNYDDSIRGEI